MNFPIRALLISADGRVTEVVLSGWPDYRNHLNGGEFFISVSAYVTVWISDDALTEGDLAPAYNNIASVLCGRSIRGPVLVTGLFPDGQGDVTSVGRKAVELAAQLAAVLVEDNEHECHT